MGKNNTPTPRGTARGRVISTPRSSKSSQSPIQRRRYGNSRSNTPGSRRCVGRYCDIPMSPRSINKTGMLRNKMTPKSKAKRESTQSPKSKINKFFAQRLGIKQFQKNLEAHKREVSANRKKGSPRGTPRGSPRGSPRK